MAMNTMPIDSHMSLHDFSTIRDSTTRLKNQSVRKIDKYDIVNGSFLQIDSRKNKLVDLSTIQVREPQSMITGQR
jgi:hypothetical protein